MTITATRLDLRKVAGRIGAEIRGVDVSRDFDAETLRLVTQALHEHKVLFFRGVELDDAGQQRFARQFGELTTAHPTVPGTEEAPNVLAVDSRSGGRANRWHTDVTFVVNPPKASTLRSLVIPAYGGDTLFASSAAAYRDLPEQLRLLADSLYAVHTNDYDYAPQQLDTEQKRLYREVFVSRKFQTSHPVVRVHPDSGERGLFIGGFAQRIVGLSPGESRDLLRVLQAYVTRPENTVRWQWQVGDLVLFDNRITQHYAVDDYGDQPRLLHRVTVAGDVPVGVDGRPSQALEGDAAHYTPVAA